MAMLLGVHRINFMQYYAISIRLLFIYKDYNKIRNTISTHSAIMYVEADQQTRILNNTSQYLLRMTLFELVKEGKT